MGFTHAIAMLALPHTILKPTLDVYITGRLPLYLLPRRNHHPIHNLNNSLIFDTPIYSQLKNNLL